MDKAAYGVLLLLGIAIVLSLANPEAAERRALRNMQEQRMMQIEYEHAHRWEQEQQPIMDMAAVSLSVVAMIGLTGFSLVVFAAVGIALVNWGRGLNWEKRYAMKQLEAHKQIAIAQATHQHALPPSHYAPHITTTAASTTGGPTVIDQAVEQPELPGPIDLVDLAFSPSAGRLLLGLGPGGEFITVSGKQLMHVALSGSTGSGKTNTGRLLIAQLLAIGSQVVIANPHHTSYDAESGDDWRGIERRLHLAPAVKSDEISYLLGWLAHDELQRRLDRRQAGQRPGGALTLYLDELPVIVQEVPGAAAQLGKLLRQGRALGLYVMGASQDFLTKTLGGGSGIREAYRTVYYAGGDLVGARSLLDMRQGEIDESQLGRGVVYLRSATTSPARLCRVPLASNAAIARLLSDDEPLHARAVGESVLGAEGVADGGQSGATTGAAATTAAIGRAGLSAQAERVRAAMLEGLSQSDVIRRIWGVEPNTRKGKRAAEEYRAILAEIARAAG
jgi:hypothetical protein